MKLGLASTKWGSWTPLARLVTSTRSPPISFATEAKSGVVVTILSFASTSAEKKKPHSIIAIIIFLISSLQKLVRPMLPNKKFPLHPHGMDQAAAPLNIIQVVLKPPL